MLAIADELTENGFVLRYRTDETDDGLSGKEGTFLICSFWLVSALSIIGEEQRAQDLMERLLRVASPLGLFAEEFDVETGRHLGNFPQAFSHLALIEAAARIIASERASELHVSARRARGRHMQAPPSGEQYGIAHGDSEAVITQVGATLRRYRVGGARRDRRLRRRRARHRWPRTGARALAQQVDRRSLRVPRPRNVRRR